MVAAWTAVALPARATYGARVTADEPQYLLSALSLAEDLDLDVSDEIRDRSYEPFHEITIDPQTEPDADGREVSPHDPLLPVLLAVPMAVGGWAGAKALLCVVAGALAAALVWVATRRFGVATGPATVVVLAFSLGAPLTAYGVQVYPELPAALAVTGAVAALTGPLDRRGRWLLVATVVALPWLSVKYAPVAAVLVAIGGWRVWQRCDRRALRGPAVGLALAGLAYLVVHRIVYGGWTAYASGDHFVGGELTVVGSDPDYPGRSQRLLGLLVDRGFGLAAWAPVFLLAVPALAALLRRRPPGWDALVLPLAAGWATATWVALTMHGYWWPGRQTVVVLPCAVLAVAWWAAGSRSGGTSARLGAHWCRQNGRLGLVAGLGVAGMVLWGWVVVEVLRERLRLIIDFEQTRDPLYRAWRRVLPDLRVPTAATPWLMGAWGVVLAALAWWGWRSAGRDEDAGAGERPDPDRTAVDLDGERAVG